MKKESFAESMSERVYREGVRQTHTLQNKAPPLVSELTELNYSVFKKSDYFCPIHAHPFFQLDVILSGTCHLKIENSFSFIAKRGDGLIIPPLVKHGSSSPSAFTLSSFKFHLFPRYTAFFGSHPSRIRIPPFLLEGIRSFAKLEQKKSPFCGLHATSVLTQCLIETLKDTLPNPQDPQNMDEFRLHLWPLLEEISKKPYDPWSVQQLAKHCGMSLNYFSAQFKKLLRQNPAQYLFQNKLRAAAQELALGKEITVKSIAEKSGYQTVHSFSRAFKLAFGTGPGAFRHRLH